MPAQIQVLVISGSMGTGKTTVLGEASDLLTQAAVAHAAIDVDALGISCLPDTATDDLTFRNLACVWGNYAAAGATRLLLAMAVESAAAREGVRAAIPGAEITVCRLRARLDTMQARVRQREPGMFQDRFVARAAELEALLDAAQLEDFSVDNDGRSVTDAAREMLVSARWLEG